MPGSVKAFLRNNQNNLKAPLFKSRYVINKSSLIWNKILIKAQDNGKLEVRRIDFISHC